MGRTFLVSLDLAMTASGHLSKSAGFPALKQCLRTPPAGAVDEAPWCRVDCRQQRRRAAYSRTRRVRPGWNQATYSPASGRRRRHKISLPRSLQSADRPGYRATLHKSKNDSVTHVTRLQQKLLRPWAACSMAASMPMMLPMSFLSLRTLLGEFSIPFRRL